MSKRHLATAVCLIVFGIALGVQAQNDPTPTEQAVGDAVATLLAQTQQAPAQINLTATVQAALEQALTATAQAATPAPIDAASVEVVDTTEIDLVAGPVGRGAYLAPDGERFVHRDDDTLCVYAQDAAEPHCVELPEQLSALDPETIRWSPDSRYITFNENFFVMLVDADVWVWDTTTDAVSDLTDDGINRLEFGEDNWKSIDIAPTWMPDGRIVFLRYSRIDDTVIPPEIYTIEPDGSNLEKLGELEISELFAVYALNATEDHLFYNYFNPDDVPENGVWMSDLDGSNPEQIAEAVERMPPASVSASPDDRYVLVNIASNNFLDFSPEQSVLQLIDVENQEMLLIDPDHFVAGAGWSPDGTALAYIVNNRRNEGDDENGLYITDTPGEAGRLVLAGEFNQLTPRLRQTLTWGANNIILLSHSPMQGLVLVQLGS